MRNVLSYGRSQEPSPLARYGVAVACAAAAAFTTHISGIPLGVALPSILAVLVAAWYGGMGPALLAWGFSVVSIVSYFAVRVGTPGFEDRTAEKYLPLVALFSAIALFGGWLSAKQRSTALSLRKARDDLEARVQDLARTNAVLESEIRERKRIETSLRESEARSSALVGSIDEIVYEFDVDGTYLNIWTRDGRLLARPREQLLGRRLNDFYDHERAQRMTEAFRRVFASGQAETREYWNDVQAGRRWFTARISPITSADGSRRAICCLVRDNTEQKRGDQRFAAQYGVTRALAESDNFDAAAPNVLATIGENLEWDFGALWTVDRNGLQIRCANTWHAADFDAAEFDSTTRNHALKSGDGRPGRVWQTAQADWMTDVAEDPGFLRKEAAVRAGLHSTVAFPILLEGEAFGVVEFLSRESRHRDEDQLATLAAIGSQIGQFIKRKRAEDDLRRSEQELRDVVDTIPAMAWTVAPDESRTFVNRRWAEYAGLSTQSTMADWNSVVHPDDAEQYFANSSTARAAGTPFEAEARFRRVTDGEYRWFLVRGVPLHDEQGIIRKWYRVSTDIDDVKRAESLLAAERRILEMVAKGDSLSQILDTLCRLVEEQDPKVLASILLLDGDRLRHGAAPSLPAEFIATINGLSIGPTAGSCGTAAYLGKQVIVSDIAADPSWVEFRGGALAHSLRACWSTPIISSEGKVIATFATYHREPRKPSRSDYETIEQLTHLAGVAIQSKLAEDAVQKRERRFRALIEHAYDAVLLLKADGTVSYASPSVERVLGYRPEELLDRKALELIHLDHLDSFSNRFACLVKQTDSSETEVEWLFRHKDKSWRWIQSVAANLLDEPEVRSVVVNLRDVTERKQAEAAVREAQTDLARVSRMNTLGELAASIAHEINQPLGAIVTNAGAGLRWLNAGTPNLAEVGETLARIQKDGQRAADVIGRIRALARKAPMHMDGLSINDVIREVLALTHAEMDRSRVVLRTRLAENLRPISGDRVQIQQVILNLIVNAIEAMHDSEPRELLISSEHAEQGNVRVSIRDSGPGLDSGSIDRIFNSFFTTKPGGMGMGLSICRSIVERHGGRLSARANAPRGAIFEFDLPAEANTAAAA